MRKAAILGVFAVLLMSDMTGIELSLVPGLSAKNLMLYALAGWITLDAAVDGTRGGILGRSHDYMPLHIAFALSIVIATISAVVCLLLVKYPDYTPRYAVTGLKVSAVDYYLMLFVFLTGLRNAEEAVWVAKGMLNFVTVGCLISLADMLGLVDLGIMTPRSDGRLQGPMNSNEYGSLMAFYLPITLALVYVSRGAIRVLWIVTAAIYVLLMLFTTSRGAIAGLAGGACFGALLMRRHVTARQIVVTVVMLFAFVVVALIFLTVEHSDLLYQRFIGTSQTGDRFDLMSGRNVIWGSALSMMADAPWTLLFGFGWKAFGVLNEYASHNEYLEYLFNLGMIGLLLILLIYGLIVRYVVVAVDLARWDTRPILMGFLFGYLSVLVAISFTNLHSPWLFVWAMTGVILRLAANPAPVASGRAEPHSQLGRFPHSGVGSRRLSQRGRGA